MALSSFTHSVGAPGVGTGSALRTALNTNLSVNWTVGSVVTFDGGTGNERTYFVAEHAGGGSVMFCIGEGATCTASTVVNGAALQSYQESTSVTQTLAVVVDVSGAGAAGSLAYELYTSGTDPGGAGFWSAITRHTSAYTMADFKTTATGLALCVTEDVSASVMALILTGKSTIAGRTNTRHVIACGDLTEAPENARTYPNMLISVEGEADASGNDVFDFRMSYVDDSDTLQNVFGWPLGTNDNDPSTAWTASNDPQNDGSTLTQTIPLNEFPRFNNRNEGRLKKDYFRATRTAKTVTTVFSTSNFYQVMDALLIAHDATGVPSF